MFIYVFSGARVLFLTKKIYALYKVDISANTIDINVFEMIYDTAGGSCKRRQLYSDGIISSHLYCQVSLRVIIPTTLEKEWRLKIVPSWEGF
jgi:hypothetical protein